MKKFIYLQEENGNFQKYEYENISDLNEEFKKRNIKIGAWAKIGVGAKIEARANIGVGATIGADATIGECAKIEAGTTIGECATIGKLAKIGAWAKIEALAKIEADNCFFAVNLYKYSCGAWVESRRGEMIQLGCFTRTREEWEKDFWNNPKEFPNDNSEKSKARLIAFKMCCYFLDLIKN